MRIIKTTDSFPTDRLGQLAYYNGMDTLSLFEIHSGLMNEMDHRHRQVYTFEMSLQAALLEMSFNGLPVDLSRRHLMIQQTEREKAKVDDILHQLCDAIGFYEWYLLYARQCFGAAIGEDPTTLPSSWAEWLMVSVSTRREWKRIAGEQAIKDFQKALKEAGEPFNANSPAQKLQLFYHFFGSPSNTICETKFPDLLPPWNKTRGLTEYKSRGTNGEYTPSVDREALEKILAKECTPDDAAYWAQPFAQCCLVLADLNKTLGFLNCRLEDGIFRSSFGSVTDTGRLNSKKNAQGYGWNCFPPGAEALTKNGWVTLESIIDGTEILQWQPSGELSWAPAQRVESYHEGHLVCITGEQMGISVTPNHRLVLEGHHRGPDFYEATAAELCGRSSTTRMKLSGTINGTWNVPRLVAAYLADGSLENPATNYWRCSFKKERKIQRIRVLLAEAGLEWREHESKHEHINKRFSFNIPDEWPTDWGPWVLNLTPESANTLLDELAFWDGSPRGSSLHFFTARKYRAEWVQTLAHICGRGATIVESPQSAGSWSDTLMYKVNVKPRGWAVVEDKHKTCRQYAGPVYCVNVPSSYFLVRQHGKICVTGNSQNVTPKLRIIFTAPLGYKLSATDYAQIESRCVAARCFTQFGATAYINATECGDLHSLACSMVWPQFDWPSDFTLEWLAKHGPFPKDMLKAAKIIAGKEFYRGKSYRDVSKTLGHGTSYMGKPPQMSKHSHIPVKYIEHYQEVFFSVFPEMRQWHNWVIEQIQVHGEMTTLLGRTRQFHDRPSDDSTIRKAVAFEPQSMGADYTNTALLQLLKASIAEKLPIQLRVQKHDELLITFEEKDEDVVIPKLVETMEHRLILKSPTGVTREWYVPAEPQVGWNLGKRSPSNPDGLVDWPDSRTRTENPFSLLG